MSFHRNVLAMLTGTAMAQAIPLAISPLLTRLYTPEAIGLQTLFMGWAAALGVLATCRYDLAVVLPDDDREADRVTALVAVICASMMLLLALVMALFASRLDDLSGYAGHITWLWLLIPMLAFTTLTQLGTSYASRARSFGRIAKAAVLNQATYAVIAIAVGVWGAHTEGLVWAKIAGQVVAAAAIFATFGVCIRRALTDVDWPAVRQTASKFRQFLIYNTPYSLIGTVARDMPIFVFAAISASANAGFYGLTRTVLMAPTLLISNALSQVFYREAVALKGTEQLLKLTLGLLRLGLIAGAPLFAFCAIWGDETFRLLFGEGWIRAGQFAMIMAPAAWMALQTGWPERLFEVSMRQDLSFKVQISADVLTVVAVTLPLLMGMDVIVSVAAFTVANVLYHTVYLWTIFRAASFSTAPLGRTLATGWLIFGFSCLIIGAIRWLTDTSLAAGLLVAICCAGTALFIGRNLWRQVVTLMQVKDS